MVELSNLAFFHTSEYSSVKAEHFATIDPNIQLTKKKSKRVLSEKKEEKQNLDKIAVTNALSKISVFIYILEYIS